MSKKKELIDFDDVAERALKNPEVMAGYVRARAMRLAAEAVKRVRQTRKLSQAEVARSMGKPQSLIARIEGARSNATVETLYEIAEATGTELVISFRKSRAGSDAGKG